MGHLFQGRYKALLVEEDRYLLELVRYIHLNPVRSGLVARTEDYACSGGMLISERGLYTLVDLGDTIESRSINIKFVTENNRRTYDK